MAPRLPRLPLNWKGDQAEAPDGTRYFITSEWMHPGRQYWPLCLRPKEEIIPGSVYEGSQRAGMFPEALPPDFPDEEEVFGPGKCCVRREQAERWAEVDAARRAG